MNTHEKDDLEKNKQNIIAMESGMQDQVPSQMKLPVVQCEES